MSTAQFVEMLDRRTSSVGSADLSAATTLVQDVLGVAIAGTATAEGATVARVMRSSGREGGIVVPAVARGFDVAAAALVCGTSAYSIGLTDTHARSITHPGPSVVAAALAVGQAVGASGSAFLRAIIVGCEAITRIGAVVNPSHRARGFHPTATCNPFGSALAACYLLGCDPEQKLWALGLAGSMSGGLYEFRRDGAMLMALHGGLPASSGVTAAYLAADGFTGPVTVLEGQEGFFRAFADQTQPELLLADHGELAIRQLSLRPYCSCRYAHAAIDALEGIWRDIGRPAPELIDQVVIRTHRIAVEQESEPTSVVGARLSTRFNVALALVHGPRLTEVTVNDLADSRIRAMADQITIEEDPEMTALFPHRWACGVSVRMRDGRALERRVDTPRGEPDNPMSPAEIDQKFARLTEPVIGQAATHRVREAVSALIDAPDLSELINATSHVDGGS